MIAATGLSGDAAIIDIGSGASRLVDDLLKRKFRNVTVLDLSGAALLAAKQRLGAAGSDVQWVVADVTKWETTETFDLWHDRAAFHFLTAAEDRAVYLSRLKSALKPGGYCIIATFAPDGPERCSGLEIVRYDAESLSRALGDQFSLLKTERHSHMTPWKSEQRFQFSLFCHSACNI